MDYENYLRNGEFDSDLLRAALFAAIYDLSK